MKGRRPGSRGRSPSATRAATSPATGPRPVAWLQERGEAALEFVLIVAGFIIPMVILASMVTIYQRGVFRFISWFLSQPAP